MKIILMLLEEHLFITLSLQLSFLYNEWMTELTGIRL